MIKSQFKIFQSMFEKNYLVIDANQEITKNRTSIKLEYGEIQRKFLNQFIPVKQDLNEE